MNFNYTCPPLATVASGLVCPFGSNENRYFFGKSAFRLVKAPAPGRLRGQGKSNGYEDNSRSMTLTSPVHVSANGLRPWSRLGSRSTSVAPLRGYFALREPYLDSPALARGGAAAGQSWNVATICMKPRMGGGIYRTTASSAALRYFESFFSNAKNIS